MDLRILIAWEYGMLQDKAQAWFLSTFSVSLLVLFSFNSKHLTVFSHTAYYLN